MFLSPLKIKESRISRWRAKRNNIKQNKKISQLPKSFKPFNLLFFLVNKEEKRLKKADKKTRLKMEGYRE